MELTVMGFDSPVLHLICDEKYDKRRIYFKYKS